MIFLIWRCYKIQIFKRQNAQNWSQCCCRLELEFVTNTTYTLCSSKNVLDMKFKQTLLTKAFTQKGYNAHIVIGKYSYWWTKKWIMRLVCSYASTHAWQGLGHKSIPNPPKFCPLVLFYVFDALLFGNFGFICQNHCQWNLGNILILLLLSIIAVLTSRSKK